MPASADNPASGRQPTRILIIDDHEISRAAYRALLRTEGLDVVADMSAGDQALAAARALRPDVAIVDVSPAAPSTFGLAGELLAWPDPPVVILTSSADRAEFGTRLNGHRFVGKADLCAAAVAQLASGLSWAGYRGRYQRFQSLPLRMAGARVLAVQISRHGGPEELTLVERPDPVAAAGQVVVRNKWIGVNYVDLQHRAGQPYPVRLPLIPGTEAAGTVVAVGAGADPGLAGAPVVHFGHLCGVYAEMTAVPTEFVVPLAPDVALDAAAAIAMNGTTAYVLTSMACRVGPGDVVVVQAAAGATGGAVVQLATAAGAEVIAITSSAGKAREAVALGARHGFALDQAPDPVAAVLSVTGGRGADVVYDAGGRDTFEMSLDLLATRGTLVLYGQSSGPVAPFDPGRLSGITGAGRGAGSLTVSWVAASHYLTSQHDRSAAVGAILGRLAAGRLSPRIAERFPLARASEAHALLASRTVLGKILLEA